MTQPFHLTQATLPYN